MTDKFPSVEIKDIRGGEAQKPTEQKGSGVVSDGFAALIEKCKVWTCSSQSIHLFMTGLPNVGKSTFIASLPVLFGDDFDATAETRQNLESEYGDRVQSPRATYKPVQLCFTIKNLIKGRYDRTFIITDDGGEWLEPAMDRLGGQDEGVVERERLGQIRAELHKSHGFLYLVPWDDLSGPDADKRQHLAESFHAFELALKNRFANPSVAIVVTRCDLEEGVLTSVGNHFTVRFRDRVAAQVKKVLEPRTLNESTCRVFPVSSLGFDNFRHVDNNGSHYHTPRGPIRPLGGREVFRWIADQRSLSAGRRTSKFSFAFIFIVAFISLFGLINFVQPAPETVSMRLTAEFDQEMAKLLNNNGDSDDALSSSIREIKVLKGTWVNKIEDITSDLSAEEKSALIKAIEGKVNGTLEQRCARLIERANGELKNLNDGNVGIEEVKSAFKVVAEIHAGIRDPKDKAKVDEITNGALDLARRYRAQQDDRKEVVDAARDLATKVSDESVKAFLNEVQSEAFQSLYAEWKENLRSTIQKHTDPIARFEKIRDLSVNEEKWSTAKKEGTQKELDEVRKVHAYAEFMVGPQKKSARDPFKRTIVLDELRITGYKLPDITLSENFQIDGQLRHESFVQGKVLTVKGGVFQEPHKSIVVDWQPGQKIRFELKDYVKPGGTSKARNADLIVLDSINPRRFPRGQEIHILNQRWSSKEKGDGGREVIVNFKVEGLPECPEILQDLIEAAEGASPHR